MKENLTILNIPKFYRTLLLGSGIAVVLIVLFVIYDDLSILFFILAQVLVIGLSIAIGISRSQEQKEIQINGLSVQIDDDTFDLSEVKSFEKVIAGVTPYLVLRFHYRKTVYLAMRKKSAEYERFEKLIATFLDEIRRYNEANKSERILQYSKSHTKTSRAINSLILIISLTMIIWTLLVDSSLYSSKIELFGSISLLGLLIVITSRTLWKK